MQQYKKLEKQILTVSEIEKMGVETTYIASKFKCSIFPLDRKYLKNEEFENMNKIMNGETSMPLFSCYKIPLFKDKNVETLNDEGYICSDTKDGVLEKVQEYIIKQIQSYIDHINEHNQYIDNMPFIKRKLLSAYHKKDSDAIASDNNKYIELANNYIEKIKECVLFSEENRECEFEIPVDFSELFKSKEIFFINFNLDNSNYGLKKSKVSDIKIEYQPYNVFEFDKKNIPLDISIRFSLSEFPDITFQINKRNSEDYFSFTNLPGVSYPMFDKESAKIEIKETISKFVDSMDCIID